MVSEQEKKWIEEVFITKNKMFQQYLYNCCHDYQLVADVSQETFMILLLLPEGYLTSLSHIQKLLYTVGIRVMRNTIRKKGMIAKNILNVEEILYSNTLEMPKGGMFDYYPLGDKTLQAVKELKSLDQVAVISYMYSIPLTVLQRAYNSERKDKATPNLIAKLKVALKQLRRSIFPEEKKEYYTKTLRRDELTDKIYTMKLSNMTYKQIAKELNMNINSVKARVLRRVRVMEKYPEHYADMKNMLNKN